MGNRALAWKQASSRTSILCLAAEDYQGENPVTLVTGKWPCDSGENIQVASESYHAVTGMFANQCDLDSAKGA